MAGENQVLIPLFTTIRIDDDACDVWAQHAAYIFGLGRAGVVPLLAS